MRSTVNKFVFYSLCIFLLNPVLGLHADTTCNCPTPPGGEIKCPPGNTAFCTIRDGKVYGECEAPPKGATGNQLKAWLLSKVLGVPVEPSQVDANPLFKRVLEAGRYDNPQTKEIVNFRLPQIE